MSVKGKLNNSRHNKYQSYPEHCFVAVAEIVMMLTLTAAYT